MRFFAWVMCVSMLFGGDQRRMFNVPNLQFDPSNNSGTPNELEFLLSSQPNRSEMISNRYIMYSTVMELGVAMSVPNPRVACLAYSLLVGDQRYVAPHASDLLAESVLLVRFGHQDRDVKKIDSLSGQKFEDFINKRGSIHVLPPEYLDRARNGLGLSNPTENKVLVIYANKAPEEEEEATEKYIGEIKNIDLIDQSQIPETIRSFLKNDKTIKPYPNERLTPYNSSSVVLWNARRRAELAILQNPEYVLRDLQEYTLGELQSVSNDLQTLCEQSRFKNLIVNSYRDCSEQTMDYIQENLLSWQKPKQFIALTVERDVMQIKQIDIKTQTIEEENHMSDSKKFITKVGYQAKIYPWMAGQMFVILLGSQNFMGFAFKVCFGALSTFLIWLFFPMTSIIFAVLYLFSWKLIDIALGEIAISKRNRLKPYFSFLS